MAQARFLVVGELAWRLSLESVVLDNLLTGQASAGNYRSRADGSAFVVAQALSQARHHLAIAAAVGDDIYGKKLINDLDMVGIDSELIEIKEDESTKLICDINQGKKDSLSIAYDNNLKSTVNLDRAISASDWVYLTEGCQDLYQISELLHQTFLHQARAVLQISQLKSKDLKRFGYLLEDVDTLIITSSLAQKLTTKQDLDLAAQVLLKDVNTVIIISKKRLLLAVGDRLVSLESSEINAADYTKLGALIVSYLTRVKQPDLVRVLASAWQLVSDKKYNIREKSL